MLSGNTMRRGVSPKVLLLLRTQHLSGHWKLSEILLNPIAIDSKPQFPSLRGSVSSAKAEMFSSPRRLTLRQKCM